MKDHWEKLGNEVHALKGQLEALLEMVPQSAKFYTATANINKQWKKLQHAFDDMDPFISPAKSVAVTNALLAHQPLAEAWQLWKDYLVEQHGLFMRSRAEVMALKRLAELSNGDPVKAVRYLEYAMGRMDKNFYAVNEVEAAASKTTDHIPASGKMVVKLPVQYIKAPSGSPVEGEKENQKTPEKPANTFNMKDEVEKFNKQKSKKFKN